jgi:chromate transporter
MGASERPSFGAALRYWLVLGCTSFGGPAGQIALMHAELVERRRWIGEQRFAHALHSCMLLPGPEAQQLATYLGWLLHGRWGGIAAGSLFVLPSLLLMTMLAWIYLRWGQQPLVASVFYAVKPAVVALVLLAAWRMARRTFTHRLHLAVALAALLAVAVGGVPFPAVVAGAALVGWLAARSGPAAAAPAEPAQAAGGGADLARAALIDDAAPLPEHARPSRTRLVRALALGLGLWGAAFALLGLWPGVPETLWTMARFFTQAALVSFGGAYAVLPYVMQGAVEQYRWLTATQMLDGLALGESTPGPLIMIVAWVGFLGGWQHALLGPEQRLAAGMLAAVVATLFTFLPSFLFILIGAPWFEATRGRAALAGPLACIGAAVVGVIVDLGLGLARVVLWTVAGLDPLAAALMAGSLLALASGRVGVMPLLAACALLGAGAAALGLPLSSAS